MAVGKMSFGVVNSCGNDVSAAQPYRSHLDLIGFNPYHIRYVTVLPFWVFRHSVVAKPPIFGTNMASNSHVTIAKQYTKHVGLCLCDPKGIANNLRCAVHPQCTIANNLRTRSELEITHGTRSAACQ